MDLLMRLGDEGIEQEVEEHEVLCRRESPICEIRIDRLRYDAKS